MFWAVETVLPLSLVELLREMEMRPATTCSLQHLINHQTEPLLIPVRALCPTLLGLESGQLLPNCKDPGSAC